MGDKPINLLSLDGGGIRGLSELYILEEMMLRIKYKYKLEKAPLPADFFDIIGGSSTGGIIALLLGRLRLSIPQAKEKYIEIMKRVFDFSTNFFLETSRFNGDDLVSAVRKVLTDMLGPGHEEDCLRELVDPSCKVFVCAIPQQDVRPPAGPTLFRTYKVGKHETHNCTIYDACRATSAEPAYFGPVEIGESYEREKFIGGGVGYNNPIEQVIQEAESVYPGRKVACVVSIGAGLAREIKFPDSPDMSHPKLSTALMDMARESDTVAEKMEVRFRKATETYFRFSVDRGLDNLNLQECEDIPNVKTYTTSYARQASICDKIDTVVHRLVVSKAQYQANGSTAVVPLTHHISASRPAVPDQHIKRAELTWHIDDASRPHFPLNTHDISVAPRTHLPDAAWLVPFEKNLSFTGRVSELENLRSALFIQDQTAKVSITGLGGVGKTQLALAMAFKIRNEFKDCSVFWIPSTSRDSIEKAMADIARELNIPGANEEKADAKSLVQDYLSKQSAGRWLLIFDNSDDISIWLEPSESGHSSTLRRHTDYLPTSPGRGSIVFTTRDKKTAVKLTGKNVVHVSEMDPTCSKELLRNNLSDAELVHDDASATELLEMLTFLPLAIIQAAAYINENSMDLAGYVSLLGKQETDVIDLLSENFEDEGRYRDSQNPVALTWLISFKQIQKADSLAAEYLSLMACFDYKGIPRPLLLSGESQNRQTHAFGTLKAYSFISCSKDDSPISIHRLVHMATRNWLRKEKSLSEWTSTAVSKLAGFFDSKPPLSTRRYCMPHAFSTLELAASDGHQNDKLASLMSTYGYCLIIDNRFREAETVLQNAAGILKRTVGATNESTLRAEYRLSLAQCALLLWKEAETTLVNLLEILKEANNFNNDWKANTIRSLANVYTAQGRTKEAGELLQQVLSYPYLSTLDTLIINIDLMATMDPEDLDGETINFIKRSLDEQTSILGLQDTKILQATSNLFHLLCYQGRLDEAVMYAEKAVESSEMVYGASSIRTLSFKADLSHILYSLGRHTDALALLTEAIEGLRGTVDEDHHLLVGGMEILEQWRSQMSSSSLQ